jgi:hypothetical protein
LAYRAGIVDMDIIYALGGKKLVNIWVKFKPIIEEYRKNGEYELDDYVCLGEMAEAHSKWVKDDPLVMKYRRIGAGVTSTQ